MAKPSFLMTRPDFRDKVSSKLQDFCIALDRAHDNGERQWVLEDHFLDYIVDQLIEAQQHGYLFGVQETRSKLRAK